MFHPIDILGRLMSKDCGWAASSSNTRGHMIGPLRYTTATLQTGTWLVLIIYNYKMNSPAQSVWYSRESPRATRPRRATRSHGCWLCPDGTAGSKACLGPEEAGRSHHTPGQISYTPASSPPKQAFLERRVQRPRWQYWSSHSHLRYQTLLSKVYNRYIGPMRGKRQYITDGTETFE